MENVRTHINAFNTYVKTWVLLSLCVGLVTGSASALFLWLLSEATQFREAHLWMIMLLPFGGYLIGWIYYTYGTEVVRGNNQIIEEYRSPRRIIPFRMAPMIFLGTIMTHLFGGSAGREGTAVQMGGALADQATRWFGLSDDSRRILLLMGVSGGFASVFGTPWAGAVFALEVMFYRKLHFSAVLPVVLTALLADFICHQYPIQHTIYVISEVPPLQAENVGWSILAGMVFGWGAMIFSILTRFWTDFFHKNIYYLPLRPVIGGIMIVLLVFFTDTTRYLGLGVPVIVDSFQTSVYPYDFFLKILFTSLTLGAGFKGGEVTPLFFIGATLGFTLSWIVPLPPSLLAGMGFVGVFAGAIHAPLTCTVMGAELFGMESAIYVFISCLMAYLISGRQGIYSAQILNGIKGSIYNYRDRKQRNAAP